MDEGQEKTESIGKFLKRIREEKNVSIEQVAYATRIGLRMLNALENDDHSNLPSPTFVKGYIQAYVKYLRVDPQEILQRYESFLATAPNLNKDNFQANYFYVKERSQERHRVLLVILLLAVMLSVAGVYFVLKSKREKNKLAHQKALEIMKLEQAANPGHANKPGDAKTELFTTAKSPENSALSATHTAPKEATHVKAPIPSTPASIPPVASIPPAPTKPEKEKEKDKTPATTIIPAAVQAAKPEEKKKYNLFITAPDQDVWVRLQTDDETVREFTIKAKQRILLHANKVIKIFSGNLAGLHAVMNGKEIPTLTTPERSKSAVLPESEVLNYPLPLFPPTGHGPDGKDDDTSQTEN